jgi:glycosyltransferase involved in cell wall biosynthesis
MAVLEAMQCGLPILAGEAAGGTPWMLEHGRAGVLVNIKSQTAIAEGLHRILSNGSIAAEISERAYRRARTVFSPDEVASSYVDLYLKVLGTSR